MDQEPGGDPNESGIFDSMPDRPESPAKLERRLKRERAKAMVSFAAMQKREMHATLAFIREKNRKKRRKELLVRLARNWPIAVGLLLGALSPLIRDMVADIRPWGMWLVFPFVVISGRPEVYLGGRIGQMLPAWMLYAQFPLEALLIRITLRHRVTISGVFWQLCLYHFLGAAELFLVSGTLNQMMAR
jgi:hypothetical protein